MTTDLLLQVDIEEQFNVSRATVRRARRDGVLPGVPLGTGKGSRMRYGFRRDDVESWRKTLHAKAGHTKRLWTDDELAAVMELRATCTAAQAAAYIGRTASSVNLMWSKLGANQAVPVVAVHRVPFTLPANAILLAKSCTRCGKLRDARYYRPISRQGGQPDVICVVCRNELGRSRNPDNQYKANMLLVQQITQEQAFNENKRYTVDEVEILRDTSITELEAAFKLNRSYMAVYDKRRRLGVIEPKYQKLNLGDNHWTINFPKAAEALAAYYAAMETSTEEITMEGEM